MRPHGRAGRFGTAGTAGTALPRPLERVLIPRFGMIVWPSPGGGVAARSMGGRPGRRGPKEAARWFTLSGDDGRVAAVDSAKAPEKTQA